MLISFLSLVMLSVLPLSWFSHGGRFAKSLALSSALLCVENFVCNLFRLASGAILRNTLEGAFALSFVLWGDFMSKDEFQYFKGSHNPIGVFQSIHFDSQFFQANPDFFHPDGIWLFCGAQGSGKTLSAVKTAKKLLAAYPKSIFCSNLDIHGLDRPIIPFTDYSLIGDLKNDEKGVIFLIDELHILFNSLESKNIPISEMANFCQMRKVRRVILGTSQVYGRIAKPIREQLKYAILCKSYLKYLQVNRVVDPNGENAKGEKDGELDGEHVFTSWFFHRPEDYQAYDTYTKIERIERKGVLK